MTRQLSIQDAARALNLSERTIRRHIKQGKLKAELIDGRYVVHIRVDNDTSVVYTQLIQQLQSENAYLRDQLIHRDQQIDHLTQLLAVQTKNNTMLTEQMRTIDDKRPWWKRLLNR